MTGKNVVQQTDKPKFDGLKWLTIWVLLIAGIIVNYFYSATAWSIRAAIGIVLAAVLVAIALQTAKGQKAWGFVKGARTELRKVVWPTRQETIQTTLIVVGMVVVTALFMWGVDSFFMWAVSWMTGQR